MHTSSYGILIALLATVLVGCSSLGNGASTPREPEVTFDGLHRVHAARIARLWVRPGASLEGKTKILPSFDGLSYRRPPTNRRDNFALSEHRMEQLEQTLHDVFIEELTRGNGWQMTDTPGPDVVKIRARLIDVVVRTSSESRAGRDRTYSASAGEATLLLEIYDAETRQILARVADRRAAQRSDGSMMRSDSIDNRTQTRRMFRRWAQRLREGLDDVRARGTLEP